MKLNKAQLADMFGRSQRTIDGWLEKGLPAEQVPAPDKPRHGYVFDTERCIAWYVKWQRDKRGGSGETDAKGRLLEIQVELAELDLDERRGELIAADDALKTFGKLVADARQRLVALAGSLASKLAATSDPVRVKDELDGAHREVLADLHGHYGVLAAGGEGIQPEPEATAEPVTD